jgi:thiosulfate reductase/polysulfide reductase chain A
MRTGKAEEVFKSVCRVCHGGCGALLTVRDGRLVKVSPDPDSPFNRGQMCVKGLATPEIMYHPSRLLNPLKRDGERGSGKWKTVTWDQALDEIADRLTRMKGESGAESIALGQGTGRHHYMHVVRFANCLGTPNWYEPGLANCFIPRITVSNLTYGGFVAADYYGEVNPETILFWGHNPLVSGPDGELSFPLKRALDKGSFGIAIDPRRSETAKKCGLWLPLRPGTDAALALAMIHVIINEKVYDSDFVEKWTVGFEELKDHVRDFTPAWAEAITWVPASDIAAAARRYATHKPSVLEWGVSIEQNPNSLQTVRAVALLRGLTGNIDVPGSDIFGNDIVLSYPVMRNALPQGVSAKRLGAGEFKLLGGFRALMPSAHIPALFRAMRTGDPYRVRALLVFGSNPLATIANARAVEEALSKLDLMVVTDLFMTPTAARADFVLPAAFWPEVNQIVELPYVAESAVFAQQKVVQVAECRQDEDILDDLARRMDLPGSDMTLTDILDGRLESTGITFEELKSRTMIFPAHEYRRFEQKGFRTPSRKVELYCKTLKKMGYDPLPTYREPPESPVSRPDLATDFPYVLTTGGRRREFFHSEQRQVESLRGRRKDPVAELHPTTAGNHGIVDGDWIQVRSPRGKAKFRAVVTEDIRENVVNIDHGWWFPEKEAPDYGVWCSNANMLTSDGPPYDPAFGSYQLRGLLCSVEK